MRICKIEGCGKKHYSKGYCSKHYQQYLKYGHILERTTHDSNEIVICEDYAEIVLYNKDNIKIARALIDIEDIDKIKNYKWYLNSDGYVYNNKVGLLHRFLIGPSNDMVVDHINNNKFDNRKANLRICTAQQNNMNKSKYKGGSQFKGVCWHKQKNKWQAQIQINSKSKYIGLYDNELEASIEYDKAALLYHGIYAKLNHDIENYTDYIIDLGLNTDNFNK